MAVPFPSPARCLNGCLLCLPFLPRFVSLLPAFIVFFSSPSPLVFPPRGQSCRWVLVCFFFYYLYLLYFQYSFFSHLLAISLSRSHLAFSFLLIIILQPFTLSYLPYIYKPHLHFFKIFSSSKSPTTSTHLLLLLFPSSTPYLLSPHTLHPSRSPISFILNVPHLSSTLHSPLRNPHLLICSLHYTFKSDIVSLTPSLSKLHSHRI